MLVIHPTSPKIRKNSSTILQTESQTETDSQTVRQTDRQTDRQSDRQRNRQGENIATVNVADGNYFFYHRASYQRKGGNIQAS